MKLLAPRKGCCLYPRNGFWSLRREGYVRFVLCSKRKWSKKRWVGWRSLCERTCWRVLRVVASSSTIGITFLSLREDDKLVKILTEQAESWCLKTCHNRSRWILWSKSLTLAWYVSEKSMMTGPSYISKIFMRFKVSKWLITSFRLSSAKLYSILALAMHSIQDRVNQPDPALFACEQQTCNWWSGLDYKIWPIFLKCDFIRFGVAFKRSWVLCLSSKVACSFDFIPLAWRPCPLQIIMIVAAKTGPLGSPCLICWSFSGCEI